MSNFNCIKSRIFILVCTLISTCTWADSNQIKLFSQGELEITAEVILPDSYASNTTITYPVLFVLDGYWTKESIQRSYKNLRFDNQVPEMIHVSISYPESVVNIEDKRMNDLTPKYDTLFKRGGKAKDLLSLLTDQIIPYVDKHYPIDQNRKILTGHSLAGLFTLYTMYQSTSSFTHYVANSPSALWADEVLAEIDRNYRKNSNQLNTNLFITFGEKEYVPYIDALRSYIESLKASRYENLNLTIDTVDGLRHAGMSTHGFLQGVLWAFSQNPPGGVSGFEALHNKVFKENKEIQN